MDKTHFEVESNTVMKRSPFVSLYFPGGSDGEASACNAGDLGSIPGSGRYSGEGNGNSIQYSCLENPMDGGAWQAIVHGVSFDNLLFLKRTFSFLISL